MDKMTMKADALSILGDPDLVAELIEDQQKRKREKGGLEEMVLKADKGIEMEVEVGMEYRPYGGATTIADALAYVEAIAEAREEIKDIDRSLSIWDSVVENILADDTIKDKKQALRRVLAELKNMLQEKKSMVSKSQGGSKMGIVSTRGAITLKGALRNLAESAAGKNYQVSLGVVVKEIERAIQNLPAGNRERAKAQLKADLQPYIETENVVKKGSIKWCAMINSGLNPQTGRPLEEIANPTVEQITEKGIVSIEKAIRDSAARQARRGKPKGKRDSSRTPGTVSVREAARRASGLE